MLSYIRPVIGLKSLFDVWRLRSSLAKQNITKLSELLNGQIYISQRERYVLYQILRDLGWSGKTVLVPDYTCPSMADAIHRSGNKIITYRITSPFNIDVNHFYECLDKKPDAVLASHVYGHPMPVRELVLEHFHDAADRPLLISDLAHAQSITPEDNRVNGYDVLLYSLAYYKPMSFPDLGIGVLRGNLTVERNTIELDNSVVKTLLELIVFYGREIVLKTPLLKLLYRIAPPKGEGSDWSIPKSRVLSSNVAFLEHVIGRDRSDLQWQFLYYDRILAGISQIRSLSIDRTLANYYPISVEPRYRNQLHEFCLKQNIYLGRIFAYIDPDPQGIYRYGDWLADRVLNLPIGLHITRKDMDCVGQVLQKYFMILEKYNENSN